MVSDASLSKIPEGLWISVNPDFQRLEQPFVARLRESMTLGSWVYCQTPDEPSLLEVGLSLLHDYIKGCDRPLHLVGHGTGGLLALLYAHRYPQRVKSLSLLAVGIDAAHNWHAVPGG